MMSHQTFSLQFINSQHSSFHYTSLRKTAYSQTRIIKLFVILSMLYAQTIALSVQQGLEEKSWRFEEVIITNFTLKVAKWSECSCGSKGIQYPIEVICFDDVTQTEVNIENCNDVMFSRAGNTLNVGESTIHVNETLKRMRNTTQTFRNCVNHSCDQPEQNLRIWQTGHWLQCSWGRKNREVNCVNKGGQKQPDLDCLVHSPKPVSETICGRSVSDCIVGPLKWSSCIPCKENQYQIGSRPVLRPPFNGGAQCSRDLHRVRKCPQPGLMCSSQWTPCFHFSSENQAGNVYSGLGIGYQMKLMNTKYKGVELNRKDCSEKLLTDVKLCYLNMTKNLLCSDSKPHLGNCVKCWKYRWIYSDYEPAISLLNGKFSSPTNCGPYEESRHAICECLEKSAKEPAQLMKCAGVMVFLNLQIVIVFFEFLITSPSIMIFSQYIRRLDRNKGAPLIYPEVVSSDDTLYDGSFGVVVLFRWKTPRWNIQPNSLCQNALGPSESLMRTGHRECSNKSVECRYTEWSAWSDCLTMQETKTKYASLNGLSFRYRDLLPRLNEDYDDSSGQRNERLLCHSRGAVTQARRCWPATFSVTETALINSTYEGDDQRKTLKCGDKIVNCYANLTKSKFISFQFQEQKEYHFCEEKSVPCVGECVLTEWSAWSDWWTIPSSSNEIITETRQRRRERSVLSFGTIHVDEIGEHFKCDGFRIPFVNKFKAESKLYQNETMIFRKANFELTPFGVSACSPLSTNSSKAHHQSVDDHGVQYKWLEGLQTMQYDWVVAIGNGNNSRLFEEKRLIEMFQLMRPSRQEQCFIMTSRDCVTTDWSQWIITDSGLSRFRRVIAPPWGMGKPCGPLEQKNVEVFFWITSEMSDTCSELRLEDCKLCGNSQTGKQPKTAVKLPNLECRKKADGNEHGDLVDSIYCRGLQLPDITHLCDVGHTHTSSYHSPRKGSSDGHHYSTMNTDLWQYQEYYEHQKRIEAFSRDVAVNREIDWYTFAIWGSWSLCKACEVQSGAQYYSGYRYRYRKDVQPFPFDFCKLQDLIKAVEQKKKKKDVLLGYKKGVHFDIKYCLFQESPIFWPVPDLEHFAVNLNSGQSGGDRTLCGKGNLVQTYSQPNSKPCFWKPETHETSFTEVVTLKHECSDWLKDIRSATKMICNNRENITWPSSLYIPFEYQPKITFDSIFTIKQTAVNSNWSVWSDCVDLTYQLCGKGRQYRTRSNSNSQFRATSTPSPRSQFIEARDCIKECPISCSLPVPEQKVGQEYSNDVQELCWSQPQPSSKQSAGTDKGTECRVTNWSHYSQCAKEERISDPFHFRTRQPIDLRQFESAPECKRIRESPGHYLIDVALCNETLRGNTISYTTQGVGQCFVKEAQKLLFIEPSFFWQKCKWPCDERLSSCNSTVSLDSSSILGSNGDTSDAFTLPLGLKIFSLSVSVVSLTIFCFSTFVALKIEFMLKNEAYFESEKQKSLISCTCRDLVLTSAATRCLFGRETLGRRNHHQSSTIPLSSA